MELEIFITNGIIDIHRVQMILEPVTSLSGSEGP